MDENTEINKKKQQICAINRETVHKICSGQVVLNLAIAVKELVENAIDAGATNIDIRLKEYGSDLLEVSDNGSGVGERHFSALTLKHFTSKLREFSDLQSISTLGFRGEALSSLCALSDLSVTTRHKSVEYGTKIEYDTNGHIKSQTKCARQIGTTVTLTNLFTTLPVRHKEFIKNLKREFTKMCNLLYAYCLVAESVRIQCTNQTKKGTRTTVVATQGSKTVKENIICVFGINQLESLVEIKMIEPEEKYLEDYGIKKPTNSDLPFKLEGFISKCTHGSGRSTSDRQFFYINSRPCEPTKITKLLNEIYKYFNGAQYPFVFLNIKTSQSQIDVNVTPDKRQIFMEEEKLLLATLKTSLLELFKSFPSTLRVQNLDITKKSREIDKKNLAETLKNWTKSNEKILDNRGTKRELSQTKGVMSFIHKKRLKVDDDFSQDLSANSSSEDEETQIEKFVQDSYNSSDSQADLSIVAPTKSKRNIKIGKPVLDGELRSSLKEFKYDYNNLKDNLNIEIKTDEIVNKINNKNCYQIKFENNPFSKTNWVRKDKDKINEIFEEVSNKTIEYDQCKITFENPVPKRAEIHENTTENIIRKSVKNPFARTNNAQINEIVEEASNKTIEYDRCKITFENPVPKTVEIHENKTENITRTFENNQFSETNNVERNETVEEVNNKIIEDRKYKIKVENLEDEKKNCETSVNSIKKKINKQLIIKSEKNNEDIIDETFQPQPSTSTAKNETELTTSTNSQNTLSFTSQNSVVDVDIPDLQSLIKKISLSQSTESKSPQIKFRSELDSKNAEAELERHVSKDMFEKMEIVGQFNKGFIITKLGSDLFIIDQHATDEKYNFETLQKTTVIQNQRLVVPKPLELTAANELLLIDNLEIFTKNGFEFQIDENAEPMHKVKLTAMPVSKNWEFGKEAIDELLFMLQEDGATENMRPSGIRTMFASRACRKSVMIGSSLSNSDMRRLVNHMGEIDQPWNCPHGRPTMRHLINLDLIQIDDSSSEDELGEEDEENT